MKQGSKMKTHVLALLLSIASVASFAQTTGNFKGKILDQSTKQPVTGATVQIDHSQFEAVSDTSAMFTINNIPAGTYAVTVSYIGFQTKNISEVAITPGKTYYSELEILEFRASFN
ncbi:uncharacterized protein (DUF2141 family) [Dyadobacter sp. BE34]|uniref:Uncharacterized protein (DUF2141 family) n=1 Tax=Dyadobacter fermentans TaxID=94254 RepID=A0ABU1QXS4_9BACT|nr:MULTISPECIES: carboxypeptidase-like regulatory domain-containing protein [Dyadobacter]MDR6805956.1 uncharacterized protein (DUF2141 family) [Dyadobacter fermentans]MDR7043696.1 uncharacterized protein (DUF2141 family) [Dyadobacter sp. BE242]MDR7198008.1 uncharacterized protein (DUF2141 family) [Dyadobacter sp. BE34]MDR7215970.1 uncharacterized protein (DUF2141 family) [Dyadobacter sp. BE31]MDR7264504.1 uncharacterized protein (DUF2141 family) [Dyadobacter sp. BE32]